MSLGEIITFGWPGARWSIRGNDYSDLEWHSENIQLKPTPEDIAAKHLEWVSERERKHAFTRAITLGFPVAPEGYILRLEDVDRAAFAQMLALVKEALELGMITSETPQLIADHAGTRHEVTTLRFRQIMVAYGLHYKSLWDALTA